MAVFNPSSPGTVVDTRLLVPWVASFHIDTITGSGTTALTVTDDLDPNDLVLTYGGSTTMNASGTTPGAGTFESITVLGGGTLTGIAPAALFADIVTANAFRIFDGSDTINGSTAGGDFLFAGYGGNDVLDGNGGGDFFRVSGRTGMPVLTVKGDPGANDTLFIEKNIYTGETAVDLRSAKLTSINSITILDPGFTVAIRSGQLGPGISTGAGIGAISGTALFDIVKDTNGGTLDVLGALSVNPNTTLRIFGTSTAETLSGTEAADIFYGNEGADTVNGRGGNDTFYLEKLEDEFDTLNGGSGVDTVRVQGADRPVLNGFNAKASSIEAWTGDVSGNAGNNTFDFSGLTQKSNFYVYGGGGNDTIIAPAFDLFMVGEAGKDTLIGGNGEDVFVGGVGADTQTGGGADDLFGYGGVKDSAAKKALRDTITDFEAKSDKLWLPFDANKGKKDFQFFKFVKKEGADFKEKPGSVIWEQIDKAGTAKDMTVVYADTNGDQKADMAIQLKGLIDLKAGDFLFAYF